MLPPEVGRRILRASPPGAGPLLVAGLLGWLAGWVACGAISMKSHAFWSLQGTIFEVLEGSGVALGVSGERPGGVWEGSVGVLGGPGEV